MAETNLRQADAFIEAEGIVSEKDLKKENDNGQIIIKGSVTVKTSDVNFLRFSVYCAEKTKAGKDNPAYAGIETVMNEYKTIAEVGEEEADIVRVRGNIAPFAGRDGKEVVGYRANFFNRVRPDNHTPKAEFEVELFISAIVPEQVRNGEDIEESGRVIVKGWMPTYNGIEPVDLVASSELADAIESTFEPGQTAKFFGNAVNARIVTVEQTPTVIGPAQKKVKETYKNELVIVSATAPYEEDDVSTLAPYNRETIEAAKQERENALKERQQNEAKKNNTGRPSAAASGRKANFLI